MSFKFSVTAFSCMLAVAACTSTSEDDQQVAANPTPVVNPAPKPAPPLDERHHDQIEAEAARSLTRRELAAGTAKSAPQTMAAEALNGFAPAPHPRQDWRHANVPLDRENYAQLVSNPVKRASEEPVSTFSVDVDTGSYANVRRMLRQGVAVRKDAVRVEELINYFDYDYPVPTSRQQPFSVTTEIGPTPWNDKTQLLHIGLKGYEVDADDIPAANLVFLVDVSGSMRSDDKIGLLKSSLKLLTKQLDGDDRVAIVVYAGASGVVLESTPGDQRATIVSALDRLSAGGSTNGAAGIQLAYSVAEQHFIKGGVNRVLLATDGDFNVGTVNHEALMDLIEAKRKTGITLTTLGFGRGNYNDHLMEQLADKGDGNHAYIDTLNEANKTLVNELTSTLFTIAKDVKIQIEFNPAVVAEYRLIGYENRLLKREDFNNDKIDAGDIGAGHSVTALYEVALVGSGGERMDDLRYGKPTKIAGSQTELAFLKLRYKQPDSDQSTLIEAPVRRSDIENVLSRTTPNFGFSAAVAAFGQLLRGGEFTSNFSFDDARKLAVAARGEDPFGYRGEFAGLVDLAGGLAPVAVHDMETTTRLE